MPIKRKYLNKKEYNNNNENNNNTLNNNEKLNLDEIEFIYDNPNILSENNSFINFVECIFSIINSIIISCGILAIIYLFIIKFNK